MSKRQGVVLRLRAILPVAVGIIGALPVIALPTLPDARHEIQEALRQSDDSLHRKDIGGCMAGFTSDFQGEDIRGDYYGRMQTKQNLIKSFAYAQSIKAKTTLKGVTFSHGDAIVLGQEHTELAILGKRTHRLHTLIFDGLWQSVMVKTKAGWQTKREKQLTSVVTTDGVIKTIAPAKPKQVLRQQKRQCCADAPQSPHR